MLSLTCVLVPQLWHICSGWRLGKPSSVFVNPVECWAFQGSQEPLISQYVVPLLLIQELWEKTAFILTSIDDYSSWNSRFCITSNVTEPVCWLWSCRLFGWRGPLQRYNGWDLHLSQRVEGTDHLVHAVSSSGSARPVRVVEVSSNLENLKWGNK